MTPGCRRYVVMQTEGMDRLERLTMHMQEALRLRESSHLESHRLSLILLDSAAELMMHRKCQELLRDEDYAYRQRVNIERLQEWKPEKYKTADLDEHLEDLRSRTTSHSKRRAVWQDFTAKVDFLVGAGELGSPHADVLKRLHEYRNEAYHRDEIRPDTLTSAVEIYAVVACHLMVTLTPGTVIGDTDRAPASMSQFQAEFDTAADAFAIQPAIAQRLMDDAGLSSPRDLAEALQVNIEDRVTAVEEMLTELSEAWGDRGWTPATVAIALQIPDTPDNAFLKPAQVASRRVPVHLKDIKRWREVATQVLDSADTLGSFALFAAFEEEFEPLEMSAMKSMRSYEDYVNNEIDRRLGK